LETVCCEPVCYFRTKTDRAGLDRLVEMKKIPGFKKIGAIISLPLKELYKIYCSLLHKISPKRKILFNVMLENQFELFSPIYNKMYGDTRIQIYFTSTLSRKYYKIKRSEMNWYEWFKANAFGKEPTMCFLSAHNIEPSKILSDLQVRWYRWDMCINASYKPPRVIFPTTSVQIFHGFSGKFTVKEKKKKINGTINPAGEKFDALFCLSPKHAGLFLQAGFLKDKTSVLCIGFPKLDALRDGCISRDEVLKSYGADPSRMSVLYAPSWNPELSLNNIGEELIESLSHQKWTLLVKLHPKSYQFKNIESHKRKNWDHFLNTQGAKGLIQVRDQCTSRYLKAADVLITDFGSTLYEYMILNRPILYYNTPEASSIVSMPEVLPRIHQATHQFQKPQEALELLATGGFVDTAGMAEARKQLVREHFYDVGGATERAVQAIYKLLELAPPA